jgi:hypothetical protein
MKTISEEVDNALIKDTNNLDVITVVEHVCRVKQVI